MYDHHKKLEIDLPSLQTRPLDFGLASGPGCGGGGDDDDSVTQA